MRLSPKEIDIIKHIVKGEISDLYDYIKVVFSFKRIVLSEAINIPMESFPGGVTSVFEHNGNQMGTVPAGTEFLVVDDVRSLAKDIFTFGTLLNKLEKSDLIQTEDLGYRPPLKFTQIDHPPYTPVKDELTYVFNNYSNIHITRFDELEYFKEHGFKTIDEMERDKTYRLARNMGYASIGAAILISAINTFINWKLYTNERKVTITAMPQYSEPISVKIVNLPPPEKKPEKRAWIVRPRISPRAEGNRRPTPAP